MLNKIRSWLCQHLLRAVMWLTDGIYCRAVSDSTLVAVESRQWRKGNLVVAPAHMAFKQGDVFIFLGGGQ